MLSGAKVCRVTIAAYLKSNIGDRFEAKVLEMTCK